MNKQTHSEETLKRTKGKYKGDEDKHKSSTENPEKELIDIKEELKGIIKVMKYLCKDAKEITPLWFNKFYIMIYGYISQLINEIEEDLKYKNF